jgi:hypothetical protein
MRPIRIFVVTFGIALALGGACGRSKPVAPRDGGSGGATGATGGTGGGPAPDAGMEVAAPADGNLAPCLERPGELPRPPSGGLPCELIPPDFGK